MVEGKAGTKAFGMREAYRDGCLDGCDLCYCTVLTVQPEITHTMLRG